MKKIVSLATAIAILSLWVLSSCDKDDNTSEEDGIVGKWVMVTTELKDCDDTDNNNLFNYECDPGDDCRYLRFKNDDTYESILKTGAKGGTYEISGNMITRCPDDDDDCDEPVSFVLDGNTLVTTSVGATCTEVHTFSRTEN